MQKKFVTNLALLLFLNLLIKPFWILGIERVVQNTVGDEEYGVYFAVLNFSFLLNILLDFGITNFNNKNIAQNNHLLTKHFSSLFVLKLLLALVYIIVTLFIGLLIGYDVPYMKLLLILGFNQFLISMVLYLRSNLLGLHLFKTDSIISVLDRLIMIAICSVLLWGHVLDVQIDIMVFVYVQTFAYALTAFIAFIVVVRKAEFLKLRFSRAFSIMILKKSFPFAILVLLMTFYNRIDAVMLERLLPADTTMRDGHNISGAWQAGIYAKGYRLLDAANMIAYLFSVQLLPIFARMLKYKESVEQLVKLSFTLIITPAIVVAAACFFYQHQMIDLLYTAKGAEDVMTITQSFPAPLTGILNAVLEANNKEVSANVFSLLMTCFIPISTTYIFGTLLTANGNLKELNIMAGTGMLINIALNIILIPNFFAHGSAFASLTTQLLTALTQVIMAQYMFRFRINYRLLFILFTFITGVLLIGYFSTQLHFPDPAQPGKERWFINFAIMVAGCGLWAFISRQISIKAMFRILKYG